MPFNAGPGAGRHTTCRFFRCLHLSLLLLGILLQGLTAQAEPLFRLSAPTWDGPSSVTTEDGYAEFSWSLPVGEYAEIYRITENRPGSQEISFVNRRAMRVYRIEPGRYDFRVEACIKDANGKSECGQASTKLRLTVTQTALPTPSGKSVQERQVQSAVDGGPDRLRPGAWVNPDKDGQGWNFYWANRLALPDTDPLFGNAYDLIGLWYTFEAKDVFYDQEVCNCLIPSTYRPVVAELRLVNLGAGSYGGGIWVTRNGQPAQIGTATVAFGPGNTSATIIWSASFKNESILSVTDSIELLLGGDPASTNNISHLAGYWQHASEAHYSVDSLIGNIAEVVTLTMFDSAGDPLWLQELNTNLVSTNVNICLGYLDSGYSPSSSRPAGWAGTQPWIHAGCDGGQSASGNNRNGRRYFNGFSTQRFWANIDLSGASYANGSVNIGTTSNPVYLQKTANLHGIFFSGANACEVSDTTPTCAVELTWFTDGDYPTATAFAYNATTGAHSLVKTSSEPAEFGHVLNLSQPGTYQFELRLGSSTASTLIALSSTFTVNEVSIGPVAPTDLGVVWVDEASREYRVQWQHSNQAQVAYYELEESLPDSSTLIHTLTPGSSTSMTLGRRTGPFGDYLYRARACSNEACSGYTDPVPWTVTNPAGAETEHPWGDNAYGYQRVNLGWNYAMGYHFRPKVDGQVTQLGGYFNGTKVVKLFLRGEPELGALRSAVVTGNNDWSYASISPLGVTAGTEYTVAVYLAGNGGSYRSGVGLPDSLGSVEILASSYASTSSDPNAIPVNSVTNYMYGQADIGFSPGAALQAPSIAVIEDQSSSEGEVITLQIQATDPDGSVVSFSDQASLPSGLSINNAGLISGTIVTGAAAGSPWSVTISATDNDGLTDQTSFNWTVTAPNQNPIIENPGTRNSSPGDVINLPIPVSDPDGDPMSCSSGGLPPSLGVGIDGANANCVIGGTITATTDSSYLVTITVSDGNGGTANSSFDWMVSTANSSNPETPPPPGGPPNMEPTVSSSEVGAIAGQFQVDESGSARYSIPILAAPGAGGVVPRISLDYSSQSGNGPLGVGWSIGGLSAITRCSQTLEQDGPMAVRGVSLDGNDRYCLDGQRLLLVSGSYGGNGAEYRVEIDPIARVRSFGSAGAGPAYFTIEHKDGSRSEFGNSDDSRIETEASQTVLTWAQNSFADSAGNYIVYHYDESEAPVEYVVDRIEYTGNVNAATAPYARIDFVWDTGRADVTTSYVAGSALRHSKLLARIDSQAKQDAAGAYSSLRSYFFSYANDGMGRQSLQSVEECNNNARQACFAPTVFGWLSSRHGIGGAAASSSIWPSSTVLYGLQVADVSGDGRADILTTERQGANYKLKVKAPGASGALSNWGSSYSLPKKEDSTPPRVFGIDLNADGFQDVVYRKHVGNGNYHWVARLSSGSGMGSETTVSTSGFTLLDEPGFESKVVVLDFDGDGLSDLLYNKTSSAGDTHDLEVILNTYTPGGTIGFTAPTVVTSDFSNNSGQGLFPAFADNGTFELYHNRPAYYETGSMYSEGPDTPENRVFDFNGDGAVDLLLYVWREYRRCITNCPAPDGVEGALPVSQQAPADYEYAVASFWVMLTSSGTLPAPFDYQVVARGRECNLSFCANYNHLPVAHEMWPVDINADGLADLAYSDAINSWSYKLNRGNGLGSQQTLISGSLARGEQDAVRFEDLNGDGFPDLIYPSVYNDNGSNATWKVAYNRFGQSFAAPVTTGIKAGNVGGESNKENDASIFADFSGDGKTDHLFIDFDSKGKTAASGLYPGFNVTNSSTAIAPSNVITGITNGLGAATSISYKPLTDTSVYSRMRDSGNADWGAGSVVYDLVAPIFVVSQVSSSAPTYGNPEATHGMEYHYVGGKIQAGGRGFLGFGEVIAYDPQLGIRSNTRYRQDFPYTRLPADTTHALASGMQKFDTVSNTTASTPVSWGSVTASTIAVNPSGTRISYAANEWNSAVTAGGAVFPFIADSLERSYTLTGTFDRKMLTSNVYGSHGNLANSTVRTYATDGGTAFATQATVNTYNDNTANWHLGRLVTSSVTHSRAGKPSVTRRSSFAYDTATGILVQKVTEPNANFFTITTDYLLDAFGNRKQTTVTGYGMTPRGSFATFDALGRFVIEARNDIGQVTQKVNDWDAFGNVLEAENIDGVLTIAATDHMGRPFANYTETGAWSKTLNYEPPGSLCPAGTVFGARTTGGGMPTQHQCMDVLGRTIRTATDGFDGTRVYVDQYFDRSGRPERTSEPYYAGATRYWNLSSYDAIGRPTALMSAGGDDQIIQYDADPDIACTASNIRVKQTTNGLGQIQVELSNALGETTDVFDDNCGHVSYEYDANGNLTRVTGADSEMVTMSYDLAGRKIAMSDPDKGSWQYAFNPLGEMTRQRDAKSQAIDFTYDTLGRVIHRRELSGVSSLTDTTSTTHNHEMTTYQNSTSSSVTGKGQPASTVYRQGESGTILHRRDYVYDDFGRVNIASTTINGSQFAEQTTYDRFGRVFQQFDASGDGRGLRTHYNARGYLSQLQEAREGTAGAIYQQVLAMDARGNATEIRLGNGVDVFAVYEAQSGLLTRLSAYSGSVELQNVDYLFDVLGNLRERHDQSASANMREQFNYDGLNRLLAVNLSVNGATNSQTLALNYDAAGNITYKSDVGSYAYNAAQPHAVSSAGGVSFSYDANGNQTSGDGRTISYTVFDKAARITKGANEALFSYGIGNTRYQREDLQGGVTQKTTLYLGTTERIDEGGSISFKRYLGGVALATYYPTSGVQTVSYLLKDHLGSIHTALNESAQITATMHFGAFGERQDTDWRTALAGAQFASLNDITTRGFTGHEQVDDLGVVHMGGRIYDARLGRFLQADPIVQAPKNSQNLNRYSYVLNNPLSYTDPSGFFLKRLFKKWGRAIIAAVASYYTFGWASAWSGSYAWGTGATAGSLSITGAAAAGAISGFVAGAIVSGTVTGAFQGAVTGALFGGVAGHFGNEYSWKRVGVDAVAGGLSSELHGGSFKEGLNFALITSSLNLAAYKMDQLERASSSHNPNNLNKEGSGLFGHRETIAGSRRTVDPNSKTGRYLACRSVAGGCQGMPIPDSKDQLSSLFGIGYDPKGHLGYLVDSFAGPHDWMRNHISRSYIRSPVSQFDVIGNAKALSGMRKVIDQVANFMLIPPAMPFALATYVSTQPWLNSLAYQHLYDE